MTPSRVLRRFALALPLLALPLVTACHPIVDVGIWNKDQVKGAQENVAAGNPNAVKWCFMSYPTAQDPANVVRWDIASDLLVKQGSCRDVIDHADGTWCAADANDVTAVSCRAWGASAPPPTQTDTVVDYPPTGNYTAATVAIRPPVVTDVAS